MGVYGKLPDGVEGFIVALAGGALIVSAVLELMEPATDVAPLWAVAACVLIGAGAFAGLDKTVKTKLGSKSGGGLLAAITLDGIPENLALGVALIGANPLQLASLSGSTFLSNLPEAAGGARQMAKNHSKPKVRGLGRHSGVAFGRGSGRQPSAGGRPRPCAGTDSMRRRRRGHRLARHRGLSEGLQG